MIFTTPQFAVFLVTFLFLWAVCRGRARKWLLLGASYAFYGSWNPAFLSLIILSTLVDYWVGLKLQTTDNALRRKRLLWVSLGVNLGILAFFKYCNFFIDSAVAALLLLDIEASVRLLEIVLPVGISFYTFQTMSYTIDVYRGDMEPTASLLDFSVYVAFFPQLVAGPIERAQRLLPQIAQVGQENRSDLSGWGLIASGCFKKVVIADNLAAVVDPVYANPDGAYGPALWLATYAFAVQIYCDFSGYSDIAVGLARLFGIRLIQNFEAPYAAAGPSEFWRRWHISLSTWLRDYLYISLGGNRRGEWFTYRNLMLTMLLGGLWHGAAWNFVLWGAWHGLLLAALRPAPFQKFARWSAGHWLPDQAILWLRRLLFFHLVCIGWAFFRAESLGDCIVLVQGLLDVGSWDWTTWLEAVDEAGMGGYLALYATMIGLVVGLQMLWPISPSRLIEHVWKGPEALRFAFVAILLYCAALAAPEVAPPFIYFQF